MLHINMIERIFKDLRTSTTGEYKGGEIKESNLDSLAKDALNDACYPGNPREAAREQVVALFRKLM